MNMLPLVLSWVVLTTIVIALAGYRKIVARKEDAYIHVDSAPREDQELINKKLEVIDKWGKTLTIVAAVYTILVLAVFVYNAWTNTSMKIVE